MLLNLELVDKGSVPFFAGVSKANVPELGSPEYLHSKLLAIEAFILILSGNTPSSYNTCRTHLMLT